MFANEITKKVGLLTLEKTATTNELRKELHALQFQFSLSFINWIWIWCAVPISSSLIVLVCQLA